MEKYSTPERALAREIVAFLLTRGDLIASDVGLIAFRQHGEVLIADVAGCAYVVSVVVTKASNDNAEGK